jgi:creatinine amidohydrolase
MQPWLLAEVNLAYLRVNPPEVIVIPFGATEPHNLHLPYSTDTLEATIIGSKACEKAHHQGAKVMLLPTIPFGTETNQREFPLSINLNPSTLLQMIKDILQGLEYNGIRKVVLLNSHGGNEFKPFLRELYGQTKIHLFLCDWFKSIGADLMQQYFKDPGDHAGEVETAIIMAYWDHLVAKDPKTGAYLADAGTIQHTQLNAVNQGWISITRPWHLATTESGAGNPAGGQAEQGKLFVEAVTDRISNFLVELSALPMNESFPY